MAARGDPATDGYTAAGVGDTAWPRPVVLGAQYWGFGGGEGNRLRLQPKEKAGKGSCQLS